MGQDNQKAIPVSGTPDIDFYPHLYQMMSIQVEAALITNLAIQTETFVSNQQLSQLAPY